MANDSLPNADAARELPKPELSPHVHDAINAWRAEQAQAPKAADDPSYTWAKIGLGVAVGAGALLSLRSKYVRTALMDTLDFLASREKYDFEALLSPEKMMMAAAHTPGPLKIAKNGLPIFERATSLASESAQIKGIHSKDLPLYEELRGQASLSQTDLIGYLEKRYRMKGNAIDENTFLGSFNHGGLTHAAVFRGGETPLTVIQTGQFKNGKINVAAIRMIDHTSAEGRIWQQMKGTDDVLRSNVGRHGALSGRWVDAADGIKIFQDHIQGFGKRFPLIDLE